MEGHRLCAPIVPAWALLAADQGHLLKGRPLRNVLPVPEASRDARELDCRDASECVWEGFLARSITPAKGPTEASSASEVEREVALKMGVDPSAVQLYLQARGLERVRRKVAGINRYFYRFCFTIGGLKSQSASYVRLGG